MLLSVVPVVLPIALSIGGIKDRLFISTRLHVKANFLCRQQPFFFFCSCLFLHARNQNFSLLKKDYINKKKSNKTKFTCRKMKIDLSLKLKRIRNSADILIR